MTKSVKLEELRKQIDEDKTEGKDSPSRKVRKILGYLLEDACDDIDDDLVNELYFVVSYKDHTTDSYGWESGPKGDEI